jgi:hypothetical protein
MKPVYRLICKRGYFDLAANGEILYDSERNYRRPGNDGHEWKVIGFGTRHNSNQIITLEAAANGADIGQGWVHDRDHGTHRMWGMPTYRRAVKVVRA